ncbi:hypothetical protein PAMP_023314 [Pampus punctatissimus]
MEAMRLPCRTERIILHGDEKELLEAATPAANTQPTTFWRCVSALQGSRLPRRLPLAASLCCILDGEKIRGSEIGKEGRKKGNPPPFPSQRARPAPVSVGRTCRRDALDFQRHRAARCPLSAGTQVTLRRSPRLTSEGPEKWAPVCKEGGRELISEGSIQLWRPNNLGDHIHFLFIFFFFSARGELKEE